MRRFNACFLSRKRCERRLKRSKLTACIFSWYKMSGHDVRDVPSRLNWLHSCCVIHGGIRESELYERVQCLFHSRRLCQGRPKQKKLAPLVLHDVDGCVRELRSYERIQLHQRYTDPEYVAADCRLYQNNSSHSLIWSFRHKDWTY